MKPITSLCHISLLLLTGGIPSALAQAEPAWGADAYGFVADHGGSSISIGPFNNIPAGGGAGFTSDVGEVDEVRGTARASAVLTTSSGLSLPEIRTFASTGAGAFSAFGAATAIETFTYSGAAEQSFTLNVNLSGTVTNMLNDFAGNFGVASIFAAESNFGAPFAFSTDQNGYLELGFARLDTLSLEQNGIDTDDATAGTLEWTMQPGDTVFLFVQGASRVYGPNAVADAFSTLTVSFVDASGLSAASTTPVPEPATYAVAAGALALAAALMRRRRRR